MIRVLWLGGDSHECINNPVPSITPIQLKAPINDLRVPSVNADGSRQKRPSTNGSKYVETCRAELGRKKTSSRLLLGTHLFTRSGNSVMSACAQPGLA